MMFNTLEDINTRPLPFEFYTANGLWADEHASNQMIAFQLSENLDVSSRRMAFIDHDETGGNAGRCPMI